AVLPKVFCSGSVFLILVTVRSTVRSQAAAAGPAIPSLPSSSSEVTMASASSRLPSNDRSDGREGGGLRRPDSRAPAKRPRRWDRRSSRTSLMEWLGRMQRQENRVPAQQGPLRSAFGNRVFFVLPLCL